MPGKDFDPKGGKYAPMVTLIQLKIVFVVFLVMQMANIYDIKGAFLMGELDEPIYMEVPQGFKKALS